MRRCALYLAAATLCCCLLSTEPAGGRRRSRRESGTDGLALSREIFRNISKQLRQSIATPPGDKRHAQNKMDEQRYRGPQNLHHHEHHWGPYFETEASQTGPVPVRGHLGSEALLNCKVGMLKDKTVMWLRRAADAVQLLTVGAAAHAGDPRVRVRFQYPNNWRLSISPLRRTDAGLYMCQISTHPPRAILANLTVLAPILTINGDETHEVKDRYYKTGSSIELTCEISPLYPQRPVAPPPAAAPPAPTTTPAPSAAPEPARTLPNMVEVLNRSWSVEPPTSAAVPTPVGTTASSTAAPAPAPAPTPRPPVDNVYGLVWKKQGKEVRDGVAMANTSSTLFVASASQSDSGAYSCHLPDSAAGAASLNVHVLVIGENQAAVHHDTGNEGLFWKPRPLFFLLLAAATTLLQ